MKLTAEQYDTYWKKGWLVVEGIFPRDLMERAAEHSLNLAMKKFDPTIPGTYHADRSADGKVALPRKVHRPFEQDPGFYGPLIYDGPMLGIVQQLTGSVPIFALDQIFFKPPRHGSPKAYHQDNAYFLVRPDDQVVTAWIAMDDVDEENGCLRYIDGSHLGDILPCKPVPGYEHDLTPDPKAIDLTKESLAIVKKGGVVFHHSRTLHTSGPNTSDRWRRGYATHWIGARSTCDNATLDHGYFRTPHLWDGWGEKYRAKESDLPIVTPKADAPPPPGSPPPAVAAKAR